MSEQFVCCKDCKYWDCHHRCSNNKHIHFGIKKDGNNWCELAKAKTLKGLA